MRKFLLFILIVAGAFIFPLRYFSLPDDVTLAVKEGVKDKVDMKHMLSDEPSKDAPKDYIDEIKLDMPYAEVEKKLGKHKETLSNQYEGKWYIYHDDYQNFTLVSFDKQRVDGIYTLQTPFKSLSGIHAKMTENEVRAKLGEPLKVLDGPEYRLNIDEKNSLLYAHEDSYITYYFDKYENNQLVAMKVVKKSLENKKRFLYTHPSPERLHDFERMDFHLINVDRVKRGLLPLSYHPKIAKTALKHSKDMANQKFFSHTNLAGLDPFERMAEDGLDYITAGENLAYGQISPIEAHHGLMNSSGHRKNILNKQFESVGIGVWFDEHNVPFYTENYITER